MNTIPFLTPPADRYGLQNRLNIWNAILERVSPLPPTLEVETAQFCCNTFLAAYLAYFVFLSEFSEAVKAVVRCVFMVVIGKATASWTRIIQKWIPIIFPPVFIAKLLCALRKAADFTLHQRVIYLFSRVSSVQLKVFKAILAENKVTKSIIRFFPILMVDFLFQLQWATQMFRHNKSVLKYVSAFIGIRVVPILNQDISVFSFCTSTVPVTVLWSKVYSLHFGSVSNRRCCVK